MTLFIVIGLLITFSVLLMWSLAACDDPTARTQMGVKLPKDSQNGH